MVLAQLLSMTGYNWTLERMASRGFHTGGLGSARKAVPELGLGRAV